MIGEIKFEIVVPGERYKLNDGTELHFLSPANPDGTTNEEVLGVVLHRLRIQGKQVASKETSRAITALETVEEILWRRAILKQNNKAAEERTAHVV